jgi:hypothetical protein
MQLLWIIFGAETISIFILTEGEAIGFFYNIVIICNFAYFIILIICIITS